jgi:hypothetical protein
MTKLQQLLGRKRKLPRGAPLRHAHGPLTTRQETHPKTKARVRRWAKRVVKRRQDAHDELI